MGRSFHSIFIRRQSTTLHTINHFPSRFLRRISHRRPPNYSSDPGFSPEMLPFVKLYLFSYNSLQACAWSLSLSLSLSRAPFRWIFTRFLGDYGVFLFSGRTISLLRILSSFLSSKTINRAYASAGDLICVAQTVAVAEVLHGAIGIVPSGLLTPLMQWSGRTHFILAVVWQIKEVQDSPWLSITLVAWCLGEMIRYPHYAFNCFDRCPFWLTYLRYTAFIVNFPIGLVGEVLIMYKALPYIENRNLFANFFSIFPFSYYDFLRVGLFFYPFLWLKLYLHMLKQRKSKLRKSDKHQGKRKRM